MKIKFFIVAFLSLVFSFDVIAGEKKTIQERIELRMVTKAALEAPLFEPAVDYDLFETLKDCKESRGRVIYHECLDSADIYKSALKNAKAKNQPLMVVFGFNSCPACLALEENVFDIDPAPRNSDIMQFLPRDYVLSFKQDPKPLKISLLRIHSRSEHGLKLATDLGVTKMANERGWHRVWSPFILFVNPKTGQLHSESYWEAKEVYCDYFAEFAASIDSLGMAGKGKPYTPRMRCKL